MTMPSLRNTHVFVIVTTTILAFKIFTQVNILTQGGPQGATNDRRALPLRGRVPPRARRLRRGDGGRLLRRSCFCVSLVQRRSSQAPRRKSRERRAPRSSAASSSRLIVTLDRAWAAGADVRHVAEGRPAADPGRSRRLSRLLGGAARRLARQLPRPCSPTSRRRSCASCSTRSLIVFSIVVLGIFANSLCAFALSRLRFGGRTLVLGIIVALDDHPGRGAGRAAAPDGQPRRLARHLSGADRAVHRAPAFDLPVLSVLHQAAEGPRRGRLP